MVKSSNFVFFIKQLHREGLVGMLEPLQIVNLYNPILAEDVLATVFWELLPELYIH